MKPQEWGGAVLSLIALLLSCYSFYTSEQAQRDVARLDAIKTEYDLFNNLARAQLEYPLAAHLFAPTGESYDLRAEQISAATASSDKQTLARLKLEEMSMAHYIFTAYEQTYYTWEHAEKVGDTGRAALLREDLNYFKDALCNRRLLWYWDEDGGNLSVNFAGRVQKFYKENTLQDCTEEKDAEGPFNHLENESKKETPAQKK